MYQLLFQWRGLNYYIACKLHIKLMIRVEKQRICSENGKIHVPADQYNRRGRRPAACHVSPKHS